MIGEGRNKGPHIWDKANRKQETANRRRQEIAGKLVNSSSTPSQQPESRDNITTLLFAADGNDVAAEAIQLEARLGMPPAGHGCGSCVSRWHYLLFSMFVFG